MVFARTSKAAARLSDAFRKREVEKVYWALTIRVPEPARGRLEHHLGKVRGKTNIMRAYDKPGPDRKPGRRW